MKTVTRFKQKTASVRRSEAINTYLINYYNLFINSRKEIDGITHEQLRFVMDQYWETGQICGFKEEITGEPVFCPFAPDDWDIYDTPVHVHFINRRAVPFIPTGQQEVNKTCVISYANQSRTPVKAQAMFYIEKIVDAEMLINSNIKSLKTPWLYATTPENREKLKRLNDDLMNDEESLFLDVDDINQLKNYTTSAPYILDKLIQYKKDRENELLTILGIDNVDVQKKEHLIVDEANANNNLINDHSDVTMNEIELFFERMNDLFNLDIQTEATSRPVESEYDKGDMDETDGGDKDE